VKGREKEPTGISVDERPHQAGKGVKEGGGGETSAVSPGRKKRNKSKSDGQVSGDRNKGEEKRSRPDRENAKSIVKTPRQNTTKKRKGKLESSDYTYKRTSEIACEK